MYVVDLIEKCCLMAAEQTLKGSKIDEERLERVEGDAKRLLVKLEAELREKYNCDPGSNDELIEALKLRGYEFHKRTKGGDKFAFDEEVMEEKGLLDILEYRKTQKLDSAFVSKIKSLLRPGGILPHHQIMFGAETGRTTMRDYNHQQTGKKGPVKPLLISRFERGFIGNVDQSQSELRVLTWLSSDQKFAQIFDYADPHRTNASRAFNVEYDKVTKSQRSDAKIVVFRAIYGGSPQTPGQKRVRDFYKNEYQVAWEWLNQTAELAMRQNYITDPYGKTRNLLRILDIKGKWAVKRAGQNFPIQSVSSHIAMELMLYCWTELKRRKMRSLALFNVHDSIVFDIHPDEIEEVKEIVKAAFVYLNNTPIAQFPLFQQLPMTGEFMYGPNWGSVEEENDEWINPVKMICSSAGKV